LPRDSRFGTTLVDIVGRHGLDAFLESTRTLVVLVEADGTPLAGNRAFHLLVGDDPSTKSVLDLVSPAQRRSARRGLASAARDQKPARARLRLGSAKAAVQYDCLFVPAGPSAALLFAEPAHVEADLLSTNEQLRDELRAAHAALAEKAAELQAVVAQVDELAHTDSLTFMQNRRSIISELQREVTYAERYATPLAISMLDIDGFKSVNDRSGHQAGDKILGTVARALRDRIRRPDEIGRYGGDEFLVVLPNTTAGAAGEQAARLCEQVRSTPIPFEGRQVHLTLSAGIAQLKPGVDNWQSLLERADRALYVAKRQGGDQWLILEA
jgi:diguanylate cyclase (GGDEF)-like protein